MRNHKVNRAELNASLSALKLQLSELAKTLVVLDDQTRPFHPVQPQVVVAESREIALQQHLLSEPTVPEWNAESTNADPLLQPAVEVICLLTQQTVKAIERVEQGAYERRP